MGDVLHDSINFIRHYLTPYYRSIARLLLRHKKWLVRALRPYGLIYNQLDTERFFAFYLIDIFNNFENHTNAYLYAFQFLDAHSVEHLLSEIETPTLIVTAMLDFLTPAYLSFEMNRQMPNSQIICHNLCTHFSLLEKPEKVGLELAEFICNDDNVKYSPHYLKFQYEEHDDVEDGLVHPRPASGDLHIHSPTASREISRRDASPKSIRRVTGAPQQDTAGDVTTTQPQTRSVSATAGNAQQLQHQVEMTVDEATNAEHADGHCTHNAFT